MSDDEKDALFASNMQHVRVMHIAAGSMIKQLLHELKKRQTYIRLYDAVPDGHRVEYAVVEGDAEWVRRIGRVLAFQTVTDTELEVRS